MQYGLLWTPTVVEWQCALYLATPPDPAGLFSEGGEVTKLYIEGSLTIPRTEIKSLTYGNTK